MVDRLSSLTLDWRRLALPAVLLLAAVLAVMLHRPGHLLGDDFALYLRQARSIFDGDTGAVIADNRFSVLNSDPLFSPVGYPWGWPLLLSPFVYLWGFDYDRLKLVEVALMLVWLTFVHGIVRRRIGALPALAVVTVLGTAPILLGHTEQLLSEFPFLAASGLFLWMLDRTLDRGRLIDASIRDLVVLGVIAAAVFNIRREGIVLPLVIASIQAAELWKVGGDPALARVRADWARIVAPHLAFFGAVVTFQLLLPTTLFPENGNSPGNLDDRWKEFPLILSDQLGLGETMWVGLVVLALAAVGIVVGLRTRPRLDLPILVLAVLSALTIGTHVRRVDRYWFQVTPWVLYFAVAACVAAGVWLWRGRRSVGRWLGVAPVAVLLIAHAVTLPTEIDDVRQFAADGRTLSGPSNPDSVPLYDAVNEMTPPDAVIAFYRARTMTLLTDRRSFQSNHLDKVSLGADYFAQRRRDSGWQPDVDEMATSGFVEIWSDDTWILWRIPDPDDGATAESDVPMEET
ncbi:hypothetical protein [Ilumatobacter nonamiensis]|uniref:hypothetical protein n=1 Tax=Ilumatobacter nonamiensis TaxID=467093 RepID=UPI0003463442|nr:hypothetical protein [Ilumatobacter nonamiensis]